MRDQAQIMLLWHNFPHGYFDDNSFNDTKGLPQVVKLSRSGACDVIQRSQVLKSVKSLERHATLWPQGRIYRMHSHMFDDRKYPSGKLNNSEIAGIRS